MAVQPMKAVSAVVLTGQLGAGELAAAGIVLGVVFIVLGATGTIGWLARLIPQSVTAGLQLGLGVSMAVLGIQLVAQTLWLGVLALACLFGFMRLPRFPAAPAAIVVAVVAGYLAGEVELPRIEFQWAWPDLVLPSWQEAVRAVELGVLPQLPLTLTNAIIVTAAIGRDLFPTQPRVTERNLALSTGIANLALAPLGAMPMCHGAGGVQAQHRFGARTGLAPVVFGLVLLVIAVCFAEGAADLFAAIPAGVVGALLLIAGTDLALTRRLFDARPACWPAIGITAVASFVVNPAVGLLFGWAVEFGRHLWVRRRFSHTRI